MPDHRIVRAKERYGMDFERADLTSIMELIRAKRGILAQRTNSGETWIITYRERPMVVQLKHCLDGPQIATFLPVDTFTAGKNKERYDQGRKKGSKPGGRQRINALRRRVEERDVVV